MVIGGSLNNVRAGLREDVSNLDGCEQKGFGDVQDWGRCSACSHAQTHPQGRLRLCARERLVER